MTIVLKEKKIEVCVRIIVTTNVVIVLHLRLLIEVKRHSVIINEKLFIRLTAA
jgi:hypothetical protein